MRYLILPIAIAFAAVWQLYHHHFMWGDLRVVSWVSGIFEYVLIPLLQTGAILIASHALGRLLTRDWMVALCLGMGGLAAITWLLGLIGLLYVPLLCLIVLLIAVYGVIKHQFAFNRTIFLTLRKWSVEDKLILLVLVWWVYRTALLSFNPSTGFDAMHAHIWQVQNFLAEGGYIFHPHHTNIALVHSLTMLQKLCWIQDPGSSMQYVAAMLSAGFLFRLGGTYHSRTAGLLAALIFLITPAVYFVYSQWFAGIFVVMYMLAALWYVSGGDYRLGIRGKIFCGIWEHHYLRRGGIIIGLLLGFGCASKITMLPFAVLVIALCGRNWWRVFFWMCLAAAPWYLVNMYQYGNPFFPFKDEWLGFLTFGTQEAVGAVYARPSLPETWFEWGWLNFWYSNNPTAPAGQMALMGPWLVALSLPLIFVRKWAKPLIVLTGMVMLMYAYWWGVEHIFHARYMIPVFALHSLLCAWGVAELCKSR